MAATQKSSRPAAEAAPEAPALDGRRLRSDASRRRIVEALLALAREGVVSPSADLVAERAEVGRRTVFRLFKDMESVYAEMHAVMLGRVARIMEDPIEGPDWRARLESLIKRRIRLFEEVLPIRIAADAHRHRSHFLQESQVRIQRMLRELLLFVLPKAIHEDPGRLEALDAVLSLDMWRRLRVDQGLSAAEAGKVWRRIVSALVD